jgi:hypothetical protein
MKSENVTLIHHVEEVVVTNRITSRWIWIHEDIKRESYSVNAYITMQFISIVLLSDKQKRRKLESALKFLKYEAEIFRKFVH